MRLISRDLRINETLACVVFVTQNRQTVSQKGFVCVCVCVYKATVTLLSLLQHDIVAVRVSHRPRQP